MEQKGTSADKQLHSIIRGVSVKQAQQMIQNKILQKLEGGPAEMRRAFKAFDRDGSGTVSKEEMIAAIRTYVRSRTDSRGRR